MGGRSVWLLDVDGVLMPSLSGDDTAWSTWADGLIDLDPPIRVAIGVLDFLHRAHASGRVEIRWCTTWQQLAPEMLAPALELPDWPYEPLAHCGGRWDKALVVERYLAEGRRIVWTDDQIHEYARCDETLRTTLNAANLTWVCPPATSGLRRVDLEVIGSRIGVALPDAG